MGDLANDTAVLARGDGHYEATLSADWEIWGPMGGYVAACALRAAGASTPQLRPAAFSCHYLSVAQFGTVDITVTPRKTGRVAVSQRVEISQGDRAILDAMVWSVGDVEGLEHDETIPPDVPGPDELRDMSELFPDGEPPFPFWNNLDEQAARVRDRVAARRSASRALAGVVAVHAHRRVRRSVDRRHPVRDPRRPPELAVGAPAARVETARVHRADPRPERRVPSPTSGHEWLLCDGAAPLSTGGLFGWTAKVWSPGGRLHASGGGQCLYRRMSG